MFQSLNLRVSETVFCIEVAMKLCYLKHNLDQSQVYYDSSMVLVCSFPTQPISLADSSGIYQQNFARKLFEGNWHLEDFHGFLGSSSLGLHIGGT